MKAIGGYFELELHKKKEYHQNAIRLNTGRNAFEYILLANNYTKVYLPFFTCDVLLEPLIRNKIEYEFYHINELLEPLFDFEFIRESEAFLYTNYFGLKDAFIKNFSSHCRNLIIDNSQSFFSKRISSIDTFYSPRKFFGLPDGAYLYSNKKLDQSFENDQSYDRFAHLLKRIDCSAEEGYNDFVCNDKNLQNQNIKQMSALTKSLLRSINYEYCEEQRKSNFIFLHGKLKNTNKLIIDNFAVGIPMVYPYWTNDLLLRERLLKNKIFTAKYWKNVLEFTDSESIEYKMTNEIVYLPIDQRYNEEDLDRIVKIVFDV